jgi:PqqD family protein of HPr-rel-A system
LWKTWGEESIVFNQSSGNTHLLNPTAAKILSIVQSQPSSAEEISLKIASESELGADEEILQRVDVVLETLDSLGLIEPLSW